MAAGTLDRMIGSLAALDEPARRALYFHVARRRGGGLVSRDQAAVAVGISRALAAFHLDKLVEAGLLVAEYRRLSGRSGPGAGRPSKLYRRSPQQLAVSLPQRSYGLAAGLLAEAVERSGAASRRALKAVASDFGRRLGAETQHRAPHPGGRDGALGAAARGLEPLGFEPEVSDTGELCLNNCPFHALTDRHRELVCGMNLALLRGYVSGGGFPGIRALLAPQPGRCCVVLTSAPGRRSSRRSPRAPRR